jgi:hypothetical protein
LASAFVRSDTGFIFAALPLRAFFSTFGKEESTFVKHVALSRHLDDDDAEVF